MASQVLALSARGLGACWQQRYGHAVVLPKTFVDSARFARTYYRADNWQCERSSGAHRPAPAHIDARVEDKLTHCPNYHHEVEPSIRQHTRLIKETLPLVPQATERTMHGHWCANCRKIVTVPVTQAHPVRRSFTYTPQSPGKMSASPPA